MPTSTDFPPDLNAAEEAAALAYCRYSADMEYVAIQKYRIPRSDVLAVIHDVFVAYLRNRSRIQDERAWIVGATYIECCQYWRRRGRDDDFEQISVRGDVIAKGENIAARVDTSAILNKLSPECSELLRLRFCEEYTAEELARHLDTSVVTARKRVHRCLVRARKAAQDRED